MTTVDDAVIRTKNLLLGQNREVIDRLKTTVDSATEAIELEFGDRGPGNGGYAELDYELVNVINDADSEWTAIRGIAGTTAAAHTAGDHIIMEPRFGKQEILDGLKAEILALPQDVFAVGSVDVTWLSTQAYMDLGVSGLDIITILQAYIEPNAGDNIETKRLSLRLIGDQDTDLTATGYIVTFGAGPAYFQSDTVVHITYGYRHDVSTFTKTTDLEATVGLSSQLVECIIYGAAFRAMSGREASRTRTDTAQQPRNAEDVPPGYLTQVGESFSRIRNELLNKERRRLRATYGVTVL